MKRINYAAENKFIRVTRFQNKKLTEFKQQTRFKVNCSGECENKQKKKLEPKTQKQVIGPVEFCTLV